MKSFLKLIMLAIIIMAVTIIMPGFIENTNHIQAVDEAEWSEENYNEEADAFTIVEIVPYKGMGEIGYLIGGKEPIDAELVSPDYFGTVSIAGDAFNMYPSYREMPLEDGQTADSGWRTGTYYLPQNGYFEKVPFENEWDSAPNLYNITEGNTGNTVDDVVPEGTGDYIARLPANEALIDTYDTWSVTNRRNVNAYFSHQSLNASNIYTTSVRYKPYSVTRIDDRTGDYDYDSENKVFYLNKGNGYYDVIFVPDNSNGRYYMLDDYVIVHDASGRYSYEGEYQYVESPNGNILRITDAPIITFLSWGGKYRWVPSDEALTKPSNYYREGDKLWVRGYKDMVVKRYQFSYVGEIVNNEWFKRNTLRIPSEHVNDYPVRLITITPAELNRPENQHYIDEASLFYINDKEYNQYIKLYENYSYEGTSLPAGSKYENNNEKKNQELNFAYNDLSWESVEKIFKRVAGIGCHKAAIILDALFYLDARDGNRGYGPYRRNVNVGINYNSQSATSCNVAKLFIMIYQRNMVDFYNAFMNPETSDRLITAVAVDSSINRSGTTGSYVRLGRSDSPDSNEALYWNGNTFLAIGLNAEGQLVNYGNNLTDTQFKSLGIYNYNISLTTTDLKDNMFMMNGAEIFSSVFLNPTTVPNSNKAKEHLDSLDPDNPVSVINIADYLNVITNNGEGYGMIGGIAYPEGEYVEGPPGDDTPPATEDTPGDSNIRSYIRVLNIQPTADFTDSMAEIEDILSGYTYKIVNMTSTQFNGSLADINSTYDMIYMGSGSGRFNKTGNVTSFNNTINNPAQGNIYFAQGDRVTNNAGTDTYIYAGNDISPYKKAMLEEFLQAGYPIMLDEDLYRMRDDSNNVLVRTDTNLYSFIVNAKANYSNNFLSMSDNYSTNKTLIMNRLIFGLRIIRPRISLEQPLLPESPEVFYQYVDPETNVFTIRFKLLPKGMNPSYFTYDAYLYLDKNGDGLFDDTEEVPISSSDGSDWRNIRESHNKVYICNINLSGFNGVRQWKLLIERTDNRKIRGYVTGYIVNSNPEVISILQLMDNDPAYNIEEDIIIDEDSLLRKYTSYDRLFDYSLDFTSMTVEEFEQLYLDSPYDSSNPMGTTKLSEYNILLLDNPTTPISDANGAVSNIRDEVADRRLSVVITKDALGYNNQQDYLSADKYFFNSLRSYNYINRDAGAGDMLIYRNMTGDFGTNLRNDSAYITTLLTKTNEGSITRYPYQINNAIKIANNRYSSWASDIFSDTKKIIGWFSLADTGNPMVEEGGLGGASPLTSYMGTYSSSPNDVINNYYLLSYDTCYYSGIVLPEADTVGNDDEMRLFVNTLIAAYRASTRVVSRPPRINIVNPVPVPDPDEESRPTIVITPDDIVDDSVFVTFEITRSSTAMDLSVLFDDESEPDGIWDDRIYPVELGVISDTPISINNTSKVVDNGTYAIKIPFDILLGSHKLTLRAVNTNGNSAALDVWLKSTKPPRVTIKEPKADTNAIAKYIYLDIDYSDILNDEEYMDGAGFTEIVFSVSEALTDVYLRLESGGSPLATDDYFICEYDGSATRTPLDLSLVHSGDRDYVLQLKKSSMANVNVRELTIVAEDLYGQEGSDSFMLLRRSLFPLD